MQIKLNQMSLAAFVGIALIACASPVRADIMLGSFNFNSSQFGNSLAESDGGTYSSSNWVNIVNADPGNPGYLTGANFDTGIANIGLFGMPDYTIGYNTPIVNGAGDDLGVVTARFSTSDTITLAVSTDGVTFSAAVAFAPGLAQSTSVGKSYFYAPSGGPFSSSLFVTPIDLSLFGLGGGASIQAVRVTGSPELDLIRVAGFGDSGGGSVPEPSTLTLWSLAAVAVAGFSWRRRKQAA